MGKGFSVLKLAPLKEKNDDVLDLDKAMRLFREIADMEDIPFGYFENGCYDRADVMCELMLQAGYAPHKAWVMDEGCGIIFRTEDGGMASWAFHVAPVLYVRAPNGAVRPLVFDPAVFDGPVTVREWTSKMPGHKESLLTPYDHVPEFFGQGFRKSRTNWQACVKNAETRLKNILETKTAAQRTVRLVAKSTLKDMFNRQVGRPRFERGKTWTTAAGLQNERRAHG